MLSTFNLFVTYYIIRVHSDSQWMVKVLFDEENISMFILLLHFCVEVIMVKIKSWSSSTLFALFIEIRTKS